MGLGSFTMDNQIGETQHVQASSGHSLGCIISNRSKAYPRVCRTGLAGGHALEAESGIDVSGLALRLAGFKPHWFGKQSIQVPSCAVPSGG